MRSHLKAAIAVAATAAGLALSTSGAAAATTAPAPAVHRLATAPGPCGGNWCGIVEASPWVNIRTGPSTSYPIRGVGYYGDTVTVYCYTTGQWESGWGGTNPYWDFILDPNTTTVGYAADVWINTGGTITSQVPHC